jgi:putative peptidoglycan lipid II flippase
MSLGTVLSRATGLLRLAAIAAALGVAETRLTDLYNFANTTPNIIYELALGGVLTSVFVPLFVELLEKEGRERAWEIVSGIINVAVVALLVLSAVGIAAAPLIARFFQSSSSDPQRETEIITFLLRLFIPQIVFYGLAAMTAGLLNAHRRFGAPMFTPILNNLAVISAFVAFHAAYPAPGGDLSGVTSSQLLLIGLGTTGGVALMAVAQFPFLRGLGRYRLSFSFSHPTARKLARLSVFVIGYVVANQIGYAIVLYLASEQFGGYSAYVAAFTFFMLPHGLFAVSIITALLPAMSEHATNERWGEFGERLSTGIRTTALLTVPAAVGYFVLAEPIVRLLERGVMTPESTELVAGVLRFFVVGLLPFSLFQLLLRAFYSLQDTRTPFLINCGAVALNIAVNIPMFHILGVKGLAAGHALSYVFGVALQARFLKARIGSLDGARVARSLFRIGGAAAGMGVVVWLAARWIEGAVDPTGFGPQVAVLAIVVAVGAAVYLAAARMLGVEELAYARSLARRKVPPRDSVSASPSDKSL